MAEKDMGKALTKVLKEFQGAAPGVMGSAVVSADGFAIASELPGSVEERRVSAMAAAMLALGEQTASEFEQGVVWKGSSWRGTMGIPSSLPPGQTLCWRP